MKVESEIKVMKILIFYKIATNKDLTMKGITLLTGIQRSSLQKILDRFEKRGWVEPKEVWEPEEITIIGQKGGFLKAYKVFWKARSAKKGSSEKRRDYAREYTRKKLLPKKKIVYRILRFPYRVGDMKGKTVPEGYKRDWRLAAKEVKQERNKYRIDWEEKKKNIEWKIRRLKPEYFKTEEEIREKRLQLNHDLAEHMKTKIKYPRFEPDPS